MMKPIERILAAVDFSDLTDEVLKAALEASVQLKAKFSALHVVQQTPFDGHFFGPMNLELVEEIEKKALVELEKRVQSLQSSEASHHLEKNCLVQIGIPYVDILRVAKQNKTQLLISGSHSRSGLTRLFLGSVAESLIRKSECPVWVVKGKCSAPQKILILTDLSESSRAGVNFGVFWAKLFGASVHLVHSFLPPLLPSFAMMDTTEYDLKMREMSQEEFDKWVGELRLSKLEVSSEFLEGDIREWIEEVVQKKKIDLIILATHGRSASFHKPLGSVTTYITRHVPISFITVRPEGFRLKEI